MKKLREQLDTKSGTPSSLLLFRRLLLFVFLVSLPSLPHTFARSCPCPRCPPSSLPSHLFTILHSVVSGHTSPTKGRLEDEKDALSERITVLEAEINRLKKGKVI